jgi:retron-type reverse transcriptase
MGLITLRPKVPSPQGVNEYRPITLLNCCLKIITKILANRLQKIDLKIIHQNQYGFLKARTIQDCLAWAFEFIYQCEASRKEILILKLDFAKAFDTIDHDAMIRIMKKMGFYDKWLTWISLIFGSSRSSVLLNGTLGRQFHCLRGVRQGDPLSPLICVSC